MEKFKQNYFIIESNGRMLKFCIRNHKTNNILIQMNPRFCTKTKRMNDLV